jgi:hypothetical protein
LIWAGSVFTHLNMHLWERWLTVLRDALADDGVLVFSTHGPDVEAAIRYGQRSYGLEPTSVASVLAGYSDMGFGYGDYPGLDEYAFRWVDRYGITVVEPGAVRSLVRACGLEVFHYIRAGWGNHQDVFACRQLLPMLVASNPT